MKEREREREREREINVPKRQKKKDCCPGKKDRTGPENAAVGHGCLRVDVERNANKI